MRKRICIGLLAGLGGLATVVCAAEQEATGERLEMEQIGVKAHTSRVPVYDSAAVTESARLTADVITREEIEAVKPRDIYDLIARAAGASSTYQGRKYMNFISMRGGDSNSVGVIIDGLYMPSSQASRILAQFPMDAIESVRIVRDSTSLTLGPLIDFGTPLSGPKQGFVVINTKKATRLEGGIVAEYGSLDTREFQLYHGNRIGNFNYRLTGTANGSNGRSGWNTNSQAQSLLFNGGYEGETFKLNTTLFYQNGMRNMEHSFTNTTNRSYWGYDPMEALWMSVGMTKLWTPNQVTSLAYAHGMLTDREVMGTSTPANNPDKITYTYLGQSDYSDNAHLWHTATMGDNTAKIGMQALFWHEPTGFAAWDGKERQEYVIGGYLQDEQKLLGGRLTLDAGLRVDDKFIKKGVDKYNPNQNTTALISNTWTAPVIATSLGAACKLDQVHTATGRVGYSYAETDTFITTLNNKKLGAEERYKYELGMEGRYHPGFNPKLTLYFYDIKNYKNAVSTSGSGVNVVNVYEAANINRYGFELGSNGSLPYGFGYDAKYSYTETNNGLTNSTMPRNMVSMLLSHRYGPLSSNFTLRYVGPFKNNSFTAATAPYPYKDVGDYTRLDANITYDYSLDKYRGRIMAYVQNMLNDKYQTIYGFPDQGTTFGFRLEAGF
jgi:outer membrane cobalamin receptor